MNFNVKFHEQKHDFPVNFGEIQTATDGGYERGYAEGEAKGYTNGYETGAKEGAEVGYAKGEADGYEKGHTEGLAEGIEQGFADGYNKANVENPFYYSTRIDNTMGGVVFPENYEAVMRFKKAPATFVYAFNNSRNLKSIKLISEDQSNVIQFNHTFRCTDDKLATLEVVDLTDFNKRFNYIQETFRWQAKLRSIFGAIDLSACTTSTQVSNAFWLCYALEDIEFVPGTIMVSLYFKDSSLLTDASIQSIIDGLADLTGATTQTLTLHTNVVAKLTDAQKATITAKNWTLAY